MATRLVPNLRKNGYEIRLNKLRLTSLETRRKRGDLKQKWVIILMSHDKIKWKIELVKNQASQNLRRGGYMFSFLRPVWFYIFKLQTNYYFLIKMVFMSYMYSFVFSVFFCFLCQKIIVCLTSFKRHPSREKRCEKNKKGTFLKITFYGIHAVNNQNFILP